MKKLTPPLCVAPGPGHTRAAEPARGRQMGFGAKGGASVAVRESDGTRSGRTFGGAGEGAALLYLDGLMNVWPALTAGSFAQARGIACGVACGVRLEIQKP